MGTLKWSKKKTIEAPIGLRISLWKAEDAPLVVRKTLLSHHPQQWLFEVLIDGKLVSDDAYHPHNFGGVIAAKQYAEKCWVQGDKAE